MKDANYQGFWRLLGLMHDAGALPHVLIIGSWAEYLYAQSGLLPGYVANLRTLDIDFLIRNQRKPRTMVNLPTAGVDYHVPFGGRKGSSYGPREQGRYAQEFYTTVKTAYTLA